MAWTAEIIGKIEGPEKNIFILVRYTDGKRTFDQKWAANGFTNDSIAAELKSLEAQDVVAGAIVIGPVVVVDTPPTQDEIDEKVFFDNLSQYRQMLKAVGLGLLAVDDKIVTDAHANLVAIWKLTYLGKIF